MKVFHLKRTQLRDRYKQSNGTVAWNKSTNDENSLNNSHLFVNVDDRGSQIRVALRGHGGRTLKLDKEGCKENSRTGNRLGSAKTAHHLICL